VVRVILLPPESNLSLRESGKTTVDLSELQEKVDVLDSTLQCLSGKDRMMPKINNSADSIRNTSNLSVGFGWHGLSFFDGLRDLAGVMVSIRWNTSQDYFVELYWVFDPAQRPGYLGKDSRDDIVGGSLGYYLKRNESYTIAYKTGLFYGREYTTDNNWAVWEALGADIGLELNYFLTSQISFSVKANALGAEIGGLAGTKNPRFGASASVGITVNLF
jgi:hypothetical protein